MRFRWSFWALLHLTPDISGFFVTIVLPLGDFLKTTSYIVPWISTTISLNLTFGILPSLVWDLEEAWRVSNGLRWAFRRLLDILYRSSVDPVCILFYFVWIDCKGKWLKLAPKCFSVMQEKLFNSIRWTWLEPHEYTC